MSAATMQYENGQAGQRAGVGGYARGWGLRAVWGQRAGGGLGVAPEIALLITAGMPPAGSGAAARRGRGSRGDAGEVEADDAGQDQADRHQLGGGHRVAEEGHADHRGARGADAGPYRVG